VHIIKIRKAKASIQKFLLFLFVFIFLSR
jgi:hypothetical protein